MKMHGEYGSSFIIHYVVRNVNYVELLLNILDLIVISRQPEWTGARRSNQRQSSVKNQNVNNLHYFVVFVSVTFFLASLFVCKYFPLNYSHQSLRQKKEEKHSRGNGNSNNNSNSVCCQCYRRLHSIWCVAKLECVLQIGNDRQNADVIEFNGHSPDREQPWGIMVLLFWPNVSA